MSKLSVPKLKPFKAENIDFCAHVFAGEPAVAALSLQVVEGEPVENASTLCCKSCALAAGEAFIAAIIREAPNG